MIKNILDFQDNDNHVLSLSYDEELSIVIETWDNKKYRVEFLDCLKLELNCGIGFEIGSICLKTVTEPGTAWEEDFIRENSGCGGYSEIIFHDPWQTERVNMRLIFDSLKITKLWR